MQHHAQDASLFNAYVEDLLGIATSSGGHASGQVHTARAEFSLASAHRHRDSHLMRAHGAIIQRDCRRRTASAIKVSETTAVATTSICHNPSGSSSAQEAAHIILAE